ncbi:MAG: outer membrane lipoprotein-sorting protein [Myxococcota bacterium]|nr:outer membrane lipoprotein-sorting protein [Myxococcota bacterium]
MLNQHSLLALTACLLCTDSFAQAPPNQVVQTAQTAVTAASTDAKAIMTAVESRDKANRVKSTLLLKIIDKGGRTRERTMRSWAMETGASERQLMVFDSPADVQGTSLLSIDHDDSKKDDDQWLYLPSLKKSTRISSGDKSGSFMGTDLTYSDMTRSATSDYEYTMVKQSISVGKGDGAEDCWLIEARPVTQKAKDETGYVKSRLWVSKSKLLPVQIKAWVREGRKLKFIKFDDLKLVGGHWMAHKISARTTRSREVLSTTIIQFADVSADNADVNDGFFDQNAQWWTR